MKSFAQAVDYVNRNQDQWDRMIDACYREWEYIPYDDMRKFEQWALDEYGIKIDPKSYNNRNYTVVNDKKYLLFQIKFS